jgi:hypothetical protein
VSVLFDRCDMMVDRSRRRGRCRQIGLPGLGVEATAPVVRSATMVHLRIDKQVIRRRRFLRPVSAMRHGVGQARRSSISAGMHHSFLAASRLCEGHVVAGR